MYWAIQGMSVVSPDLVSKLVRLTVGISTERRGCVWWRGGAAASAGSAAEDHKDRANGAATASPNRRRASRESANGEGRRLAINGRSARFFREFEFDECRQQFPIGRAGEPLGTDERERGGVQTERDRLLDVFADERFGALVLQASFESRSVQVQLLGDSFIDAGLGQFGLAGEELVVIWPEHILLAGAAGREGGIERLRVQGRV